MLLLLPRVLASGCARVRPPRARCRYKGRTARDAGAPDVASRADLLSLPLPRRSDDSALIPASPG
eukprot:scaffold1679_cov254-Prasinococcus_capsulatus_cf.AAC.1